MSLDSLIQISKLQYNSFNTFSVLSTMILFAHLRDSLSIIKGR